MTEPEVLLALSLTDEEAKRLFKDPDLWAVEGPTEVEEMMYIFELYVTADRNHGYWIDSASLPEKNGTDDQIKNLKKNRLTHFERSTLGMEYEFGGEHWNVKFSAGEIAECEVEIEGEAEFFKWLLSQNYFESVEGGIETIINKLYTLRDSH